MKFRYRGARDLIGAMGGPARVAYLLGCSDARVRMWVARGAIPDGWWLDLIAAARSVKLPHVTLEMFANWSRERRLSGRTGASKAAA